MALPSFFRGLKKNYRLYLPETKALIMFTNWAVINHHVSWKSFSDMGSHRSSGRTEAGWLWLLGSLSYERFLHMRIYRWWFKQFIYRWYVFWTISQPRLIFLLLKKQLLGFKSQLWALIGDGWRFCMCDLHFVSFEAHGQDVAYIHDTCNISKPALVDLLLVGRLAFHILGIIIPTDFHIFQRGRYTNQ